MSETSPGGPIHWRPKAGFTVIIIASAIVALGLLMPYMAEPYGVSEINAAIDSDNSRLCDKFGFKATQFSECKVDLLAMRKRHEDLLLSYSWR